MSINQLIIIAGPSCAGKTFLMKQLRQGKHPRLCAQLGITTSPSCLFTTANKFSLMHSPVFEQVVIHYDIYFQQSTNDFNFIDAIIQNADNVTIVTLCVSPDILARRLTLRFVIKSFQLITKCATLRKEVCRIRNLWRKLKIYNEHSNIVTLYNKWFKFSGQYNQVNSWCLDTNKSEITTAYPVPSEFL